MVTFGFVVILFPFLQRIFFSLNHSKSHLVQSLMPVCATMHAEQQQHTFPSLRIQNKYVGCLPFKR